MRTAAAVLAGVLLVSASGVAQTGSPGGGQPPAINDAITPFELQRLFDSWALLQAQEQLKLNDEQFARFLPRFKALQDVRRQALQQRTRVINDVRRLLMESQLDEAQVRDRLRQLQEIEGRG